MPLGTGALFKASSSAVPVSGNWIPIQAAGSLLAATSPVNSKGSGTEKSFCLRIFDLMHGFYPPLPARRLAAYCWTSAGRGVAGSAPIRFSSRSSLPRGRKRDRAENGIGALFKAASSGPAQEKRTCPAFRPFYSNVNVASFFPPTSRQPPTSSILQARRSGFCQSRVS